MNPKTLTVLVASDNAKKAGRLNEKRRIVPKSDLSQSEVEKDWEFRLIRIAAFILPEATREEWLGDLKEALEQLRSESRRRWVRTAIAFGKVCLLGIALIRIKIGDLVSPHKKKRPM